MPARGFHQVGDGGSVFRAQCAFEAVELARCGRRGFWRSRIFAGRRCSALMSHPLARRFCGFGSLFGHRVLRGYAVQALPRAEGRRSRRCFAEQLCRPLDRTTAPNNGEVQSGQGKHWERKRGLLWGRNSRSRRARIGVTTDIRREDYRLTSLAQSSLSTLHWTNSNLHKRLRQNPFSD